MSQETAIVILKEKTIRRTWHDDAWWFSVVDICGVFVMVRTNGAYYPLI